MTLPSQETKTAGGILTAATWNSDVRDAVNFLLNPPMVKCYGSGDWMNWAATGTLYLTTWDSEAYDTDSMHSTSSNTGRVVFTTAGVYRVTVNLRVVQPGSAWADNSRFNAEIRLNAGGTVILETGEATPAANSKGTLKFSFEREYAAADYIEVWAGFVQGSSAITGLNPALESGEEMSSVSAHFVGTGA